MNFGWFNDLTEDAEFSRTILHEFGHTVGCVHEHRSPAAGITWNVEMVNSYYRATAGWTPEQVHVNIFQQYSAADTSASYFDPLSLCCIPFRQS